MRLSFHNPIYRFERPIPLQWMVFISRSFVLSLLWNAPHIILAVRSLGVRTQVGQRLSRRTPTSVTFVSGEAVITPRTSMIRRRVKEVPVCYEPRLSRWRSGLRVSLVRFFISDLPVGSKKFQIDDNVVSGMCTLFNSWIHRRILRKGIAFYYPIINAPNCTGVDVTRGWLNSILLFNFVIWISNEFQKFFINDRWLVSQSLNNLKRC